jgi:ElaB/YqjD/DUF883 family membrane-anchored ribosome-binding protein
MEDQSEPILKEMEETRTSLTEKVEAIEQLVSDKVKAGADVVEHATDAANEIVANVKETVHDVTEKVEEVVKGVTDKVSQTVESVVSVFDLRKQTERHPWIVLGVSAVAGCMIGKLLFRRSQRRAASPDIHAARLKHARGGNGASHAHEPVRSKRGPVTETPRQPGLFHEHLEHLKGLAISTLLGAIRDMARRAIPGEVGTRLASELDSITTHLGAEPLRGPVLPNQPEPQEGTEEDEVRKQAASPEAVSRSVRETNRLRSGGVGPH